MSGGSEEKDADFAVAQPWPEGVVLAAEAIIASDSGKTEDAMPVAEAVVAERFSEAKDVEDAVKVSFEELEVRADPDAVRRRALSLRDAIFTDRPLGLRSDDVGRMEDIDALLLRDADRAMTILHHAAALGRPRPLRELLRYAGLCVRGHDGKAGLDAIRDYCALPDDSGNRAIDLAVRSGNAECVELLRPYVTDGDEVKAAAVKADEK